MATRDQGPLPPRNTVRSASQFPQMTGPMKVGVVSLVAGAFVLAVIVAMIAPRPDVVIQGATYSSSGCVASGTSQTVTATFSLVNRGSGDGYVTIHLLADGSTVGGNDYVVPPHATTPGRIDASLSNCASHTYSMSLSYIAPPSG